MNIHEDLRDEVSHGLKDFTPEKREAASRSLDIDEEKVVQVVAVLVLARVRGFLDTEEWKYLRGAFKTSTHYNGLPLEEKLACYAMAKTAAEMLRESNA